MSNALETTKLSKRYGRTWALQDCTLSLPAGRVAALIGPNGAGKTTLLHLSVGLLEPTAGEVQVFWPVAAAAAGRGAAAPGLCGAGHAAVQGLQGGGTADAGAQAESALG
jgi:ABC-type uncharacterized transport system ATPase subunit